MKLAEPALLFARFEQAALSRGGARDHFEMFVLDLVKVQVPEATTVAGKGGRDWGIDTLVGSFSDGELAIWQCKFVLEWNDDTPRGQVRESFKSAVKHAHENGYTIRSWTLCVPCVLSPEEHKWFDDWANRQRRDSKIRISLWNGAELRHQLLREDAQHVRREYFPDTLSVTEVSKRALEPLAETEDLAQFSDALFIRQLRAAGETETDAACGLFYATDALVRDYTEKGNVAAIDALNELHLDVHRVWTHLFNAATSSATDGGKMPGLHQQVMDEAGARPDPGDLRLRPVHKMGAAHRLVEDGRAGWVVDWRHVATEYGSEVAAAKRGEVSTAAPEIEAAVLPGAVTTSSKSAVGR